MRFTLTALSSDAPLTSCAVREAPTMICGLTAATAEDPSLDALTSANGTSRYFGAEKPVSNAIPATDVATALTSRVPRRERSAGVNVDPGAAGTPLTISDTDVTPAVINPTADTTVTSGVAVADSFTSLTDTRTRPATLHASVTDRLVRAPSCNRTRPAFGLSA